MVRSRRIVLGLIWATAGIVAGCVRDAAGPPANLDASRAALEEVGSIYRLGTVTNKRPPKDVRDFKAAAAFPAGMKAIGNGEVVVVYNKKLSDEAEEPGGGAEGEVIAYEKAAPQNGGFVLMQNRTIKKMTADEFKAATKAGKD